MAVLNRRTRGEEDDAHEDSIQEGDSEPAGVAREDEELAECDEAEVLFPFRSVQMGLKVSCRRQMRR